MVADEDSKERIYYSMAATFFGRMCLSGDIYDLNETQWQLVEEGIAFYHRFSDSEPVDGTFLNGHTVLAEYGEAQQDFSAKAWLYID